MAKIIPFKGILYNGSKVSPEEVLAPPYDIITPAYQEELYKKSPYNIVRIDFGKDHPDDHERENKYTRAKRYLETWIKDGILVNSKKPSFYVYEISYRIDGEEKKFSGFLGLVKLEEFGKGNIYPHECTYSKPKKDRLNILRFCEANISPIFSLYKSSDKKVSALLSRITLTNPYIEANDTFGAVHRLWQIDGEKDTEVIKKELENKAIFIADGHHRYETALEFQREMNSNLKSQISNLNPWDYVLMFLANMFDERLTILPTHRLVKEFPYDINRFTEYFEIETVKTDFEIAKRLKGRRHVFGFFQNRSDAWQILTYKGDNLHEIHPNLREIDVIVLHDLILNKILRVADIDYEMDARKALDKVRNGEFSAAFFLNPTKIEDVETAALSSVRMPPKSTYFYPKLLTGMVIHSFVNSF
ncbi:MAG: DUF1015 domain-containing protein [Nitrospira sp.]|nr:DUF1015 domain-containing protein [Nitrospira sp.]